VRREAISRILGGIGAALVMATALAVSDAQPSIAIENPCDFLEGVRWYLALCFLM
jgi:hypothetical protein